MLPEANVEASPRLLDAQLRAREGYLVYDSLFAWYELDAVFDAASAIPCLSFVLARFFKAEHILFNVLRAEKTTSTPYIEGALVKPCGIPCT